MQTHVHVHVLTCTYVYLKFWIDTKIVNSAIAAEIKGSM